MKRTAKEEAVEIIKEANAKVARISQKESELNERENEVQKLEEACTTRNLEKGIAFAV